MSLGCVIMVPVYINYKDKVSYVIGVFELEGFDGQSCNAYHFVSCC